MEEDAELRETVEGILGQGIKLVDVQKTTSYKSEEVLIINGRTVPLVGPEGDVIRQALLTGQVPPSDVLNALLISAGILSHPVRLETELTVKQTTLNRDAIQVSRNGCVVDERFKETKEEDLLHKTSTEIWRAVERPASSTGSSAESDCRDLPVFFQQVILEDGSDETDRAAATPPTTVRKFMSRRISFLLLCLSSESNASLRHFRPRDLCWCYFSPSLQSIFFLLCEPFYEFWDTNARHVPCWQVCFLLLLLGSRVLKSARPPFISPKKEMDDGTFV